MFRKLIQIQMASHGFPNAFDFPVERVHPEEIQKAMFFNHEGKSVTFQDRHDLAAYVKQNGKVHMVHKLFQKETVYALFLSKNS